ncbi:response regulator [Paraglaciecola hydrolytica]|uniref:Two-component system response regulator n=1 Tax=Paraglaciecola hydrolytica TaxID=1799789 RepID=A0A148KMC4_9ALTE|nr:response regulator [Paraglaciecola hydrolytica]KXI27440.1 two-component system response regulator [Paraglaciecola hydrolytica]
MNEKVTQILLVEDDASLSDWIRDYLNNKGFKVTQCMRGDEAISAITRLQPEVVILDGMLPGLDGFEVCKQARARYTGVIIMLTARDEEIDEVVGLELGADDYITKPVRARVLLTRINKAIASKFIPVSQLKSVNNTGIEQSSIEPLKLTFKGLQVDKMSRSVSLNGQVVKVSSKEFDVLWILALSAGKVISRDSLISQLRGIEYDGFDRSIDLRISKLRKKLGDESRDPLKIKTIWGKGYLFAPDAW